MEGFSCDIHRHGIIGYQRLLTLKSRAILETKDCSLLIRYGVQNAVGLLSGGIIAQAPNDYIIFPMPNEAIQHIKRLACSSRPAGLHFTTITNDPYASNDDSDDSTYSPSSDEDYDSDSSHNDDDPDGHSVTPAGATNANVNYDEEPVPDTDIRGVAIEPTGGDEEEITGVDEPITGVAEMPPPEDDDDDTTGVEAPVCVVG
eukprot:jgi/Psemu1/6619/gm1.6619_g